MHGLDGGQSWDAHAGAGSKVGAIGQGMGLGLGQHDVLRSRAKRAFVLGVPCPHALAHAAGVHACTDLIDHTGTIAVGDVALAHQWASLAVFHVRGIDA